MHSEYQLSHRLYPPRLPVAGEVAGLDGGNDLPSVSLRDGECTKKRSLPSASEQSTRAADETAPVYRDKTSTVSKGSTWTSKLDEPEHPQAVRRFTVALPKASGVVAVE